MPAVPAPIDAPIRPSLRDQLQAALGAAYTLDRELGGGGMSRVFVAREEALGRDVVVKVLAPVLAWSLSADRFAREIRLAASLQEPHIVPVLAAGVTADGLPWYTMPFVRGESLRRRIAGGPLLPGEAVGVLRDVARALDYAHARGVVHRDIKPENVLLSSGTAVVTDFGIAKALAGSKAQAPGGPAGAPPADAGPAGAPSTGAPSTGALTEIGTSLGTPAYMAPEQALGDEVDARADLYAWGVVAYELLAGRHPFAGKASAQQLVAAHLAETPRPLAEVAPAVPAPLAALVLRCLAKNRVERPASAADVLAALDAAVAAPPAPAASRPARSGHRRARLAAGGLAAACGVVLLIGVQAGRPPSRPAPAAADAPAPAPRLPAAAAAAAAPPEWPGERGGAGRAGAAIRGTRDPAAYDLYLRARYELNKGSGPSVAIPMFERVLERDPAFAAGWAALGVAWALRPTTDPGVSGIDVLPLVEQAAARALALDSLSGEAHTALGYALAAAGEVARGEALLRRGAALQPRSATARGWLAEVEYKGGRFDAAEGSLREVLALEPLNGAFLTNLASVVARDPRRWDAARGLARRATAVDAGHAGALVNAARVLAATRDHDASLALLGRLQEQQGALPGDAPLTLAVNMLALGRADSAARVLAALEREAPAPGVQESVAHLSAALGRWDRAFADAAALARARRNVSFLGYGVAPAVWRPAADDPRLRQRLRALCLTTWAGCDSVFALVARTPPLARPAGPHPAPGGR